MAHNDNSGTVFSGDLNSAIPEPAPSVRANRWNDHPATGKQPIIRDSVFTSGDPYLRRFTQLGSTAINIDTQRHRRDLLPGSTGIQRHASPRFRRCT